MPEPEPDVVDGAGSGVVTGAEASAVGLTGGSVMADVGPVGVLVGVSVAAEDVLLGALGLVGSVLAG